MDLKNIYDAAKAASDAAIVLKNEVETLFNNGTDEGIQAAIDKQPELEAANKKADEMNKLYLAMRDADKVNSNAAALFVSDAQDEADGHDDKVMTRATFESLSPVARAEFLRGGGTVQ